MATKKKSTARITLRTVLNHMHSQHHAMMKHVNGAIDSLRHDMHAMERRLTQQIDGLDKRLDDIEINVIPALKKAVGAR